MLEPATMTVRQMAKYLGIGVNKAYEIVHNGTIPSIKIGRQIKVPKKSLDSWIETASSKQAV